MKASEAFKKGLFNYASFKHQPDGSVIVTIRMRGKPGGFSFRAKNLNKPGEEILEDQTIKGWGRLG